MITAILIKDLPRTELTPSSDLNAFHLFAARLVSY